MNNIQTRKFDAEVDKILHLMIHSLYTHKEIFLRELISNAADACDKLRYLSANDANLAIGDQELSISVSAHKNDKMLVVEDNGIGMNADELSENLGTIARSGTQNFINMLSNEAKKDNALIGQFGVGFYSVFMVASSVRVISRKAGESSAYFWQSDGGGEYSIGPIESDITRGTRIELSIKDECSEFLDHFKIKNIIKNYSDHISIPIFYIDENTKHETHVNASSALWRQNKYDLTEVDYTHFYQNIAHAADKPWAVLHNKNEGRVEFINLLFIPETKTLDLFHPDRKRSVKLYIKRVFVADDGVDIVPKYMRFLRGVVDCEDLPLNISRETLQHNATIDKIRSTITDKVMDELSQKKDSDSSDYEKFWNNFGAALKEGLCEYAYNHDKLLDVCLFQSALRKTMISLSDYVANMPQEQKEIYFLVGTSAEQMRLSPQIEGLVSKGMDVLLLTDHVDNFWTTVVHKYKDYNMVSGASDVDKNPDNAEDKNDSSDNLNEKYKPLLDYFKSVLNDDVADVKISHKLTTSPACLVSSNMMDIRMERFLWEQKQIPSLSKKNLEINVGHKIIQKILADLEAGNDMIQNNDTVERLFGQSCLLEGEPINNPKHFCELINKLTAQL